jgi:hypothetical protein
MSTGGTSSSSNPSARARDQFARLVEAREDNPHADEEGVEEEQEGTGHRIGGVQAGNEDGSGEGDSVHNLAGLEGGLGCKIVRKS